jgi:predicted Zn-dependent protease
MRFSRKFANKLLMQRLVAIACLALGLACSAPISATPYLPADDGVVLERLPEKIDPSLRDVKRLRAALDRNPNDLALATRLARRAIEAARETGDPRFLGQAQSALTPWWTEPNPPAPALLLRATLRQSTHDFEAALTDLDRLIARSPNDGQALLTRATVLTVQGRYAEARADCARVARLTVPLVAIACDAAPASVSGEAASAYRALTASLGTTVGARNSADLAEWASTLAGEIAERRGDATAAESHYRAALALDPRDPYLLGAYADFLLEQKRPAEVIPLVTDYPRNDSLLLRQALAEAHLSDAKAAFERHRADLKDRFDAARRRGDSLHRREEARYALELAGDPAAALRLARDNWKVQREVADLHVLAAAAKAAGDAAALREAADWAHRNRLEDTTLNALLELR